MIRIHVNRDELRDLISTHKPGWIEDAKTKTENLASDPNAAVVSIWSPIKQVFVNLQHSKCVFCEKEIEDQPIEQDVEHFRPKNNVRRWSVPAWLADEEGVQVKQPDTGSEPGYRLLAYNYLNYAAACKTCNSTRKGDLFPVAASRRSNAKNPARMKGEKAYLIYPVSDIDDDPEELIEFYAMSPQAKKRTGFGRRRALVTIELFHLDDANRRPYLYKNRAKNIWLLYKCLKQIDEGTAVEQMEGQLVADLLTSPRNEHTNCLRCFRKLYETDPPEAGSIANGAFQFWITGSP